MDNLKKLRLGFCVSLMGLGLPQSALSAIPIEKLTTPNGTTVYYVNSPSIPMVDINVIFPNAGSIQNYLYKKGVAGFTASLMSSGVKTTDFEKDEHQIADIWADTGAQFGVGTDDDFASLSLRSLASEPNLQTALNQSFEILRSPSFPEKVLSREKINTIAAIKEQATKPAVIAQQAFTQKIYPKHPYGYILKENDVKQVTQADLMLFHACQFQAPMVTVVGALSAEKALDIAEQFEKSLPVKPKECPAAPLPTVDAPGPKSRTILHHPTATQTQIVIGQLGVPRSDPDFFPLMVGNYILGGSGFGSLLMEELREKNGLTYGVYSSFDYLKYSGTFSIDNQTRQEKAQDAEQLTYQVIEKFVKDGPSEEKLEQAKNALIKSFPLRIDSNHALARQVNNIAINQLPLDYLDTWTQQIAKVMLADVKAAMARKIHPDRLITVVVTANKDKSSKK